MGLVDDVTVEERRVVFSKEQWRAKGTIRRVPDDAPALPGSVFRLYPYGDSGVAVWLDELRCLSLGTPRRKDRRLALLKPWTLVKVLLNGRAASYSGQYYNVVEYRLLLRHGPAPLELPAAKVIDLQAALR